MKQERIDLEELIEGEGMHGIGKTTHRFRIH